MLPIWYIIVGGFLSTIAVTGNGVVIFLILTRQRLQTTTNWFVLSLAVADLFLGAGFFLVDNFCSVYSTCNYYFWYAATSFLGAASTTNLCVMTLDRYVAVVKPLRYITFMTTARIIMLIFAAWFVAFLPHFILLSLVFSKARGKDFNEHQEGFFIFDFIFFEALPVIALPVATGHLVLIARTHKRKAAALETQLRFNHRNTEGDRKRGARGRETSSVKVVFLAVAVFVMCYTSEICYTLIYQLPLMKRQPNEILFYMMELLYVVNSAINPIAYALFKKDISKNLLRLLYCKKGSFGNITPNRVTVQ